MNDLVSQNGQPKKMLLEYMADKYSLNTEEFSKTVRATCGLSTATPEQFAAFLIVAKTYDLNPLLKEIYAFAGRGGAVVPIVSIDGWVNLINSNPQLDGFDFAWEHSDNGELISCTCTIYRKDRSHPVSITEYYQECKRDTDPWKMKHRMLRHKALMQAARYSFGFAGIYDEDEGRTIADGPSDSGPPRASQPMRDITPPKQAQSVPADATPAESKIAAADGDTQPPEEDAVIWDETEERPKEKPHQIPTAGLSINKWVEKYIAAVESSDTVQEVYLWIDKNQSVLNEVDAKAKALYATIKQATERTLADLRKGNAAIPATPAKEPDDVASSPTQASAEKKDAKPPRQRKGKASTPDNLAALPEPPDQNPETILKWCDATLAAITDPDYLEEVWSSRCAPLMTGMFPPDQEEMQAMYARHEKRLGGD